jgi:UDP-N-acetylglucosamine 4,6-dehydratase
VFDGSVVLVTGGTGSFGQKAIRTLLARHKPRKLIVFSRDELKQHEMQNALRDHACMRFFLGDVRDGQRLIEAFHGVDYVIHAAALKQVPAAEYNPFEAIKTNVLGAQNVLQAAIARGVKRVVALSTDKACAPVNLYGATKLCSDKLFVSANSMAGDSGTTFSVVRYGNVVGSRGSVFPFFLSRRASGVIPVTDPRMTRFSITLQEGVDFVLGCLGRMAGGELFVPKIPSYRILDVARAIAPDARIDVVGARPGEKLHESMISDDDARMTREFDDCFVLEPAFPWWRRNGHGEQGRPVPEGFSYRSDTNDRWLTVDDLRGLLDAYLTEHSEP